MEARTHEHSGDFILCPMLQKQKLALLWKSACGKRERSKCMVVRHG